MNVDRINRVVDSRWWLLSLLIPASRRAAACKARGTHKPELIDLGRSKLCLRCGAW